MIPARFAPVLFALILSAVMSFIVSGFSTYRALGVTPDFFAAWVSTWLRAWPLSFLAALIVAPIARRIVAALTRKS